MPELQVDTEERTATLVLADGERVTASLALVFLSKRGVRYGHVPSELARLGNVCGPITLLVAEAEPAVASHDACIRMLAGDTRFDCIPQRTALGPLSFDELPVPTLVHPGEIIAVKAPASYGRPGRTVTGKPTEDAPAEPIDFTLVAGVGTELTLDGLKVTACVTGNARHIHGRVEVVAETRLDGDLSGLTGDIEVEGNLVITGDTTGPRSIRATGDITILGGVETMTLIAGGRLVVHAGIRNRSVIQAGEAIVTRFLEGSHVRGASLLVVQQNIAHCQVENVGRLYAGGSVVGGQTSVHERVVATTLGGLLQTPTRISIVPLPVTDDPRYALARERKELEAKMAQVNMRLSEARTLASRYGDKGRGQDAAALAAQLARAYGSLATHDQELVRQMEAVAATPGQPKPSAEILGEMLPGTTVTVGQCRLEVETPYAPSQLTEGAGHMNVIPLGSQVPSQV